MADETPEIIVLERIRNVARTNGTELNLSNLGLTHLPKELWQLSNLLSLDLSRNELSALPPEIGQLTSLRRLNLAVNPLTSLPPEIVQLASLRDLNLQYDRFKTVPSEIGSLKNLVSLDLSSKSFDGVEEEEEEDEGEYDEDFEYYINQIDRIPAEILNLENLNVLDPRGNPLPIPPEILEKTKDPRAILNYYFSVIKDASKPINEVKVIFVGQGSVGKTSLIRRIITGFFKGRELKTEGIKIEHWTIVNELPNDQSVIKLNIWDFGGQEIMHATHQFFLTKRSLYILVLDSRLTQEENRVEYWLKIIQSFSGDSPVLIVGNKIDQHALDIDRTGLQKKYPNIVDILETSAVMDAGIEKLKTAIIKQINKLPHIHDLLPGAWFTVKHRVEDLGGKQNYFTYDNYLELCAENNVTDESSQRTLIGFLHDLGVVLHFEDDPRLEALGILNPQWVTNGVYKILNAKALFENKGILGRWMLDGILNASEYPANKRLFIVDMMRKFELCYDIEPDKTFLVPDLLPKDEPFSGEWTSALAFQYHYNVLPSSVITRFIVRMNGFINKTVWRSGVVLKNGGNTALVKADAEDRKVYIWVSGDEHSRRDFLAKIRGEFDAIHKTIIKIEARERVPVPGHPEAEPVEYDLLLQMEHDNVELYPVLAGRKMILVNVRGLLSGVARESDRQRGETQVNIYVSGDVVSEKTERNIQVGNISEATGIAIGEDARAESQKTAGSE